MSMSNIHFYNPPPDTTEQEQINLAFREAEEIYSNDEKLTLGDKAIAIFIEGEETTQELVDKERINKRKRRIYPLIPLLFSSPISFMSYFMIENLYNGDCLVVMDKLIADGVKVDAIITDPLSQSYTL